MPDLTINGHKTHYEEQGSGEPLVFTNHLATGNAKGLMDLYGKHMEGYRAIIHDGLTMGESDHPDDISPADWVEDLRGLLDALSVPAAHIIGWAMGSRVAVRFAADYPDRVKTLTLTSTIARNEPDGDAWRRNALDISKMDPKRQDAMEAIHGKNWRKVIEFYVAFCERDDAKAYFDMYEAVNRVKVPACFIQGDTNAAVHPLQHTLDMFERLPGSWMAIYPNTESVIMGTPEEFFRVTRAYIASKS